MEEEPTMETSKQLKRQRLHTLIALDWKFVYSQISYVEIPNGIEFGDGTYERWLGHKGRALVNGMYSFIKETTQSNLVLSAM